MNNEYDYEIEEYFIDAVVEQDLIKVIDFIENNNIDPTYDSNLAMRIISEEGYNKLFDYFITLDKIDLSWNNFSFLIQAATYENTDICEKIIKNSKKIDKINTAWLNTHIKEKETKKIIKFLINVYNF